MGRQTGPASGLLAEAGGLFQSQQPEAAHLAGFSGNFSNSLFCPEVPSCWGLERPSLNQALASLCLCPVGDKEGRLQPTPFPSCLRAPSLRCCCLVPGTDSCAAWLGAPSLCQERRLQKRFSSFSQHTAVHPGSSNLKAEKQGEKHRVARQC